MSAKVAFPRSLLAGIAALALCLVSASRVSAQTVPNSTVYAAKFACGFVPGTLPTSTTPTPPAAQVVYRAVQPGSYSTVFNVMNLHKETAPPSVGNTFFNLSVHVAGLGSTNYRFTALAPLPNASVDVGGSVAHTLQYGCPEITQRLAQQFPSFVADGQFVEGYLEIEAADGGTGPPLLDVSVIHTYTERNAANGVGSSMDVQTLTGQRRCCFFFAG